MIMKSAGSNGSFFFSYRRHGSFVVAEFLTSNKRDHAALVGVLSGSDSFSFTNRAWVAPVLSLGAGGCCEALTDFIVSVEGASPVSGSFTTSGSVTLQYRIVKP